MPDPTIEQALRRLHVIEDRLHTETILYQHCQEQAEEHLRALRRLEDEQSDLRRVVAI